MRCYWFVLLVLLTADIAQAASKPHVVSFGAPTQVKLLVGPTQEKWVSIPVQTLYVDAKLKEYTTGPRHDVTDRLFVVRRAFRINDQLPDDPKKPARWLWQRGDWLLVDRQSGRISQIKLADFDTYYSSVSWYRDYAAYCGVADNGEGLYAVVVQIGSRKPIYRRSLGKTTGGDLPESECEAPHWERQPARVTFQSANGEKLTVNVVGHFADLTPDSSEEAQ